MAATCRLYYAGEFKRDKGLDYRVTGDLARCQRRSKPEQDFAALGVKLNYPRTYAVRWKQHSLLPR